MGPLLYREQIRNRNSCFDRHWRVKATVGLFSPGHVIGEISAIVLLGLNACSGHCVPALAAGLFIVYYVICDVRGGIEYPAVEVI